MEQRDSKNEAVEGLLGLAPADPSNTHAAKLTAAFGKKDPARLPDFDKIRRAVLARHNAAEADRRRFRRVWLPAAAAAVALLTVGVLLLAPRTSEVPAQLQATQVPAGQAQKLRVEDSLGLHIRSAANMTRTLTGNSLVLKADSMAALFDFEPTERLRAVRIETPHATFSVIGTRFIIQSEKDFCLLAVESGAVRVNAAGREFIVRGGEFWSERKNVQQTGKAGDAMKKLFPAFTTEQDVTAFVSAIAAKTESAAPAAPQKRIAVTLKSGSVVSGVLVSQNAAGIEIRAAAAGNQVLRFSKDEIAGIEYLK